MREDLTIEEERKVRVIYEDGYEWTREEERREAGELVDKRGPELG